eukprot:scaffold3540_cov147-Isochrysis_galbana.AAC.2
MYHWVSTAFASYGRVEPVPSVGHGSARSSRDVRDRARRRFVSLRFVQFRYNLRFDTVSVSVRGRVRHHPRQ